MGTHKTVGYERSTLGGLKALECGIRGKLFQLYWASGKTGGMTWYHRKRAAYDSTLIRLRSKDGLGSFSAKALKIPWHSTVWMNDS